MTKYIVTFGLAVAVMMAATPVDARTIYYNTDSHPYGNNAYNYGYNYQHQYQYPTYNPVQYYGGYDAQRAALIAQINQLLAELNRRSTDSKYMLSFPGYSYSYSYSNKYDHRDDDDRRDLDDDEPDVNTERVGNVTDRSAELRGEVDMNDYDDGYVFFVYGEDEDQVADIEDDYDSYDDIDEDGDDLQKFVADSRLDGDEEYELTVTGLDDDTEYFYSICVEFEDDDDDELIMCGGVEDFETDN